MSERGSVNDRLGSIKDQALKRFDTLTQCYTGAVYDFARDPRFLILCRVERDGGAEVGEGTMQFFPKDPQQGQPVDCLSAWLSVDGSMNPTSKYVGMVEVFNGGPVWGDWHDEHSEGWYIEADQRTCKGLTIQGLASDGHRYAITMQPFFMPPIPSFH
jgi:hypothetical protein